jgi:hypothetical protein
VDGEEERPVLNVVKIEAVRSRGKGEGAQERALVSKEGAVYKIHGLGVF